MMPVAMETKEINLAMDYGKPPWVFKGSALYQLHLVKAETARAFIPKELKLVEAFGYTLGGFFLANYEDSPAGTFDELVVIAGIVWNPPTSCAWAARVLVNSAKACAHGRKEVGLPSQVASFEKRVTALPATNRSRFGSFLHKIGIGDPPVIRKSCIDIQVKEMNNLRPMDICGINLTAAEPQNQPKKWMGPPAVKLSLPSFSGCTECNPNLLKYCCQINCGLRVVPTAKVMGPVEHGSSETVDSTEYKRNLSISIMLSKPILALEFSSFKMKVEAPSIISVVGTTNGTP